MQDNIKIGISTCLLGENVRYDGGHKLDRYLRDIVGQFVQWVPVCPEVECGLSIPREAMRLIGDVNAPRLVTIKSGIDYTERMQNWIKVKLDQLEKENLCGFVFKSKSPSSGMQRIKVYNKSGTPIKKGIGLFARAFMERFKLMPVEDEGRLNDPNLRENFIERIFVYKRWQDLIEKGKTPGNLVSFHSAHKLLIMAHSPKDSRKLGKIVANDKDKTSELAFEEYFEILMTALQLKASVKKNTNVLHHIMGYFKKSISADEKQELLEIIEHYHQGLLPLIVPITLLKHYIRKYQKPYLQSQHYLNPHPLELMLRNHV